MSITVNFNDNANCNVYHAPNQNYSYAVVKPHCSLSAIDASNAHLKCVVAMVNGLLVDPNYENDSHLIDSLHAISLNVGLALDMVNLANVKNSP
ncbi:hypothetical protein MOMA_09201 [Moraxella macacae 0408225]|uniref:DUF3077 domain-containing protein n=1 Tax=Moraxella macacae 0408225 TaxID=1230338 RepID=L2F6M3_9GAMM|nr:hypothetical protein [Moraxella macacae]ELA08724.1 hypothetical protein MOMA_09201 [Moraxella macacae 0408225]